MKRLPYQERKNAHRQNFANMVASSHYFQVTNSKILILTDSVQKLQKSCRCVAWWLWKHNLRINFSSIDFWPWSNTARVQELLNIVIASTFPIFLFRTTIYPPPSQLKSSSKFQKIWFICYLPMNMRFLNQFDPLHLQFTSSSRIMSI